MKLRKLILLGLLISVFVFFSGCVQEKALTLSNETPTMQQSTFTEKTPIAEITTYKEKAPTVQLPTSTEIYCISNETGKNMSLSEARNIANNSEISDQGTIRDTYSCNESTSTWWIDMNPAIEQNACNPAFVININTKAVQINWRCPVATMRIIVNGPGNVTYESN
jgi:hypothetical protein